MNMISLANTAQWLNRTIKNICLYQEIMIILIQILTFVNKFRNSLNSIMGYNKIYEVNSLKWQNKYNEYNEGSNESELRNNYY